LSAVRTQDEHVSNPPSNPRDAHASSSQRGPPPRRAPPSSVEQDQEAQHSRRNYGIAESQPPAGRSAFPTTGSSGLAAERAGYNTESVLARTSSTQIIFDSFRIDPETSIGMSRICISMGDSLGCAHTSSVPASVVSRSADLVHRTSYKRWRSRCWHVQPRYSSVKFRQKLIPQCSYACPAAISALISDKLQAD
jgi:hypothetical protein